MCISNQFHKNLINNNISIIPTVIYFFFYSLLAFNSYCFFLYYALSLNIQLSSDSTIRRTYYDTFQFQFQFYDYIQLYVLFSFYYYCFVGSFVFVVIFVYSTINKSSTISVSLYLSVLFYFSFSFSFSFSFDDGDLLYLIHLVCISYLYAYFLTCSNLLPLIHSIHS